jgi:hypothetical protein
MVRGPDSRVRKIVFSNLEKVWKIKFENNLQGGNMTDNKTTGSRSDIERALQRAADQGVVQDVIPDDKAETKEWRLAKGTFKVAA